MKKIITLFFFLFGVCLLFSQQLTKGKANRYKVKQNIECITFIDEEKIKDEVGVNRKLVGFIPGTLGRSVNNRPPVNCNITTGQITIFYIVDKSGDVIYARRYAGIDDECVVSSVVSWVQKYVKAEKGMDLSYGKYIINF